MNKLESEIIFEITACDELKALETLLGEDVVSFYPEFIAEDVTTALETLLGEDVVSL